MSDIMGGFQPEDIRISTYANASPCVRMRVTHVPTGLYTEGVDGSTLALRAQLLSKLRTIIASKFGEEVSDEQWV